MPSKLVNMHTIKFSKKNPENTLEYFRVEIGRKQKHRKILKQEDLNYVKLRI